MEHGRDWGHEDCSPQKTLHLSSLLSRASPTVLNDLFESSFPGPTDNPRVLQLLLAREPLPSIFPVALAGALPSIPTVKGRLAPLGHLHSCLIHSGMASLPATCVAYGFLQKEETMDVSPSCNGSEYTCYKELAHSQANTEWHRVLHVLPKVTTWGQQPSAG